MGEMETYVPEIPEIPEVPDSPKVPDVPEVSEASELAEEYESVKDLIETPEAPEVHADAGDGPRVQQSVKTFGMGATAEGAEGSVAGPEKAEIRHRSETTLEKEPGLGSNPSWDKTLMDSTPSVRFASRFEDQAAIREFQEKAFAKISASEEGQKFLQSIGGREALQVLFASDEGDMPTRAAGLAEQAGLDPAAVGRMVHRAAELRTLQHHPDEVLNGTRLVEQRIDFQGEDGEQHFVEVDDVIQRGDHHYLRDYKPVNIRKFEGTDAGKNWAQWMEQNVGVDFRERIRGGENPFRLNPDGAKMPEDLRAGLRNFLKETTLEHKSQLTKYSELYAQGQRLAPTQVKAAVRPYFVYR